MNTRQRIRTFLTFAIDWHPTAPVTTTRSQAIPSRSPTRFIWRHLCVRASPSKQPHAQRTSASSTATRRRTSTTQIKARSRRRISRGWRLAGRRSRSGRRRGAVGAKARGRGGWTRACLIRSYMATRRALRLIRGVAGEEVTRTTMLYRRWGSLLGRATTTFLSSR